MELQVGVACILLLITIIYIIKIKNGLYYSLFEYTVVVKENL